MYGVEHASSITFSFFVNGLLGEVNVFYKHSHIAVVSMYPPPSKRDLVVAFPIAYQEVYGETVGAMLFAVVVISTRLLL